MGQPSCAKGGVVGRVNGVLRRRIHGWAWRSDHPHDHIRLDVSVNGVLVGIGLADQKTNSLAKRNIGLGDHAFSIWCSVELSPDMLSEIEVLALTFDGVAMALPKIEAG